MKKLLLLLALVTVSFTVPSLFADNSGKKGGTDILHFFVRETMSNPGVVTNATGRINGMLVRQGKANNQKFEIDLRNLEANTPYFLKALIGDDTNFTDVAEFNTDSKGAAKVHYRRMGANGNHGLGRGKSAMPAVLNPICNIRELSVTDTNAQVVLSADLTAPDKLQYLVKRALTNDGAETNAAATLRLHSTTVRTQFRINATGLQPDAGYSLIINGNIDETKVADSNGKLNFTTLLVNPVDILDVRTIAILNGATNSVLSAQLP